jgi:UDP-N-acetylmuramoylalanine--D-glutamate ligase
MKVAIAGYGQEGVANYQYWLGLGAELTILDEHEPSQSLPPGAVVKIGPTVFNDLSAYDLVVRTASLNPNKLKSAQKVWSATNEFFAKCPAPIIGVTGTKGKGTTATLIAEILRAAGKTVHLVGNIGTPALAELPAIGPTDFVVFELSSFQLWDLEASPQTAVVLMIEPDHQDIHASMTEYIEAKANIGKYQSAEDLLVYHPTNQYSAEIAEKSPAQKKKFLSPEGAYRAHGSIGIEEVTLCLEAEVGLLGAHNLENICAAVTAAWNYTQDTAAIKAAVVNFKGLEHRLEFVRELGGVKYYNDSFSSAPGATIAAIQAFTAPEILVCGGYDRGISFTHLAQAIAQQKNLTSVVLIGETKHALAAALDAVGFSRYKIVESKNLVEITQLARSLATSGDVVLLSPGCASFDMFQNFYDRGEQFKAAVRELQ